MECQKYEYPDHMCCSCLNATRLIAARRELYVTRNNRDSLHLSGFGACFSGCSIDILIKRNQLWASKCSRLHLDEISMCHLKLKICRK